MTASTVSVIIPTYNSAGYVCEAVESVLAQTYTYRDVEIIVIDDGSTDDTRQRLEAYTPRILYEYQPNRGRSSARNRGIQLASGEWIAFLDADDTWYPSKLERQMAALAKEPRAAWAYCCVDLVNENGARLGSDFWEDTVGSGRAGMSMAYDALLRGELAISSSTVVARTEMIRQLGGFCEQLPAGEDTHLWLRIARRQSVLYMPESLGTRRVATRTLNRDRLAAYGYQHTSPALAERIVAEHHLWDTAPELANQVIGRAQITSALISFSIGDVEAGTGRLRRAQEALGDAFPTAFPSMAAYHALSAARYSERGPEMALSILAQVWANARQAHPQIGAKETQSRALMLSAISHMYHEKGEAALSARYARRALAYSANWTNAGLWKRAVQLRRSVP